MRKKLYSSIQSTRANWRLGVLMLGFFLMATMGQAQLAVTIGTSTATSSSLPFSSSSAYNYSQNLYMGTDIITAGGASVGGNITKIRFYYNAGAVNNADSMTIYMGATAKTSFSSTTDWVPTASMTPVFTGTVALPYGPGGWWEIVLQTPFSYTPTATNNLVIALDENRAGSAPASPYGSWRYTGSGSSSVYRALYNNSSTNQDPNSPPTGTRTANYNNIQLDFKTPCSGTPAPGNTNAGSLLLCSGSTTTFSLQTDYRANSGMTYQWQVDDGSGSGFVDVIGANSYTYTPSAITNTVVYQCNLACGTGSATSTPIVVNVNPLPVLSVSPFNSNALCSGNSATITASGASTYTWSPTTALSSSTVAAVVASPTVYTMYTVSGTDANGCTARATVTVSPVSKYTLATSYTVGASCVQVGDQVNLDVTTMVPVITATTSGNWEFQWTDKNNVVLQPFSGFSQLLHTPSTGGVYNYKVVMRNTACPTETTDTGRVNVTVGFSATIDSTNINCNSLLGIYKMLNAHGQTGWDTIANYDFSTTTLPATAASLSANSVITGGRCEVTQSATSKRGGFNVLNPNNLNPQYKEIDINFNLTADLPINCYSLGGADGIGWSYGDDAVYSTTGPAHNGFGTKLRISFDAADNTGNNGNLAGIYVVYGWTNASLEYGPASTGVLAFTPSVAWKQKTDQPVNIHITEAGALTLTVNGNVIFSNVQLPQAFVQASKSNWKHIFSAGTGGEGMRFAIDNVLMRYKTSLNYGITTGSNSTPPTTWQRNNGLFDSLNVGTYNLWLSNADDASCNQLVGSYTIRNINPVVDLGNDTSICPGQNLVLNAGGPFTSYLWSNGAAITQTVMASNPGTYMVTVIDSVGCQGTGIIEVAATPAPYGSTVFSSPAGGNSYFLSVVSPHDVDTYSWNFGDGSPVTNGPSSLTHTYPSNGTYTVTVVLSNAAACSTVTLTTLVNITVGIEEAAGANGISMYPNPANAALNISTDNGQWMSSISIYDVTGKVVYASNVAASATSIDVSGYQNGVYTVSITSDKGVSHRRLIITH